MMNSDKHTPKATLIVAVYNHWEWLRLVLQAITMQSETDFETIIADDGSDSSTTNQIDSFITEHPNFRITHLWHPDEGWRKNIMLNKALTKAKGEIVIFIDGDCVPHPRFIADHLQLSQPGTILTGRRVDLPEKVNEAFETEVTLPKKYFNRLRKFLILDIFNNFIHCKKSDRRWLRMMLRTLRLPFAKPSVTHEGVLGCNFSAVRKDLLSVNGFDERYLAPATGEDTDIEWRMRNAGFKVRKASHQCLMLHRRHARLGNDSEENKKLFAEVLAKGTTWTPFGITKREMP